MSDRKHNSNCSAKIVILKCILINKKLRYLPSGMVWSKGFNIIIRTRFLITSGLLHYVGFILRQTFSIVTPASSRLTLPSSMCHRNRVLLFLLSLNKIPMLDFHWPKLSHMFISEPIIVARRIWLSDWPNQNAGGNGANTTQTTLALIWELVNPEGKLRGLSDGWLNERNKN